MISNPKLISVEAVPIQLDLEAIANTPYEGFSFSKLLDNTNCSAEAVTDYHFGDVIPNVIKLAHLKEVISNIDKGEITISKGAEILNDIVLETESKQVKELYKKLFDLHEYTHKVQQELIDLKRDIHQK